MRISVRIDDDLLRTAKKLTGLTDETALINGALKALIQRESSRRLALLGGTMPGLKNVPRHALRPARLRSR